MSPHVVVSNGGSPLWPCGLELGNKGETPEAHQSRVGSKSSSFIMFFFEIHQCKRSFSSSFHPSRTGCAWMCHLRVPWQTPSKLSKTGFWLFWNDFAKCGKKIRKSGRSKVLNLLLCHLWKSWFWGATLQIDVPGCAILVSCGSPPQVVLKQHLATQKCFTFLLLWMYSSMTRTSVRRYWNFLGDSLAVCHLYSSSFCWAGLTIII